LAFTEKVWLAELEKGDIEVQIQGPYEPYEFKYQIDHTTGYVVGAFVKSFRIRFSFTSSFFGDNKGTSFC
jgi:uncharacterized protein involved in high-affinity Fe2+ transport